MERSMAMVSLLRRTTRWLPSASLCSACEMRTPRSYSGQFVNDSMHGEAEHRVKSATLCVNGRAAVLF